MGMCLDCPRLADHTCGPSRCCMDDDGATYRLGVERERSTFFSLPAQKPEPNNRHFRRRAAKLAR